MAKCETDCRDEIYTVLNKKVDKSGLWKFASVIIATTGVLWGVVSLSFSENAKLRGQVIEENKKQVVDNDKRITANALQIMKLTTIVEQQSKSNESLVKEIKDLIKEIKK